MQEGGKYFIHTVNRNLVQEDNLAANVSENQK
jgi:hypothetical protein